MATQEKVFSGFNFTFVCTHLFERGNPNMNRDLLHQRLLINECKPSSSQSFVLEVP